MLKNHFLIAVRNIWRNKTFSFIHIFGLSIGISASIVIFLIVKYELSFDKFQSHPERIYRVVMDMKFNGQVGHSSAIPAPLPGAIAAEVTGVELNVPIMQFQGDASVKVSVASPTGITPKVFKKQPDVVFTTADYFELLPIQWLAGSAPTAMKEPFSVVISESRMKQYFADAAPGDVIGRQVTYNDDLTVTITGVVRDLEEITDFTSREFISYVTISKTAMQQNFMMEVWDDWMAYSKGWVKLSDSNDKAAVELQLNLLLAKYNKNLRNDEANSMAFKLQPLDNVHFNNEYAGFGTRTAHAPTLYALLAIAAFLLLLGCINFVNLSTAVASHRAKEIGIRKTIGSTKKQLVVQFLCETLTMCVLASILSISIAPLLLQLFSDFIPQGVSFDVVRQPSILLFLGGLTVTVSLLSGVYPAFVLSQFRPAVVLKNQAFAGSPTRSAGLRKILTVSQFAIAQFFVIAALMISKQIHFSLNQDLGYRKDAIINFEVPRENPGNADVLTNQVRTLAAVEDVSVGFLPPATEGGAFSGVKFNNGTEVIAPNIQVRWGDPKYIDVYKISLVAGRNIRGGEKVNEAIINEACARALGFTNVSDALQKELINPNGTTTPIVGIMKDFHEGSFHRPIGPLFFRAGDNKRIFHVALHASQSSNWQKTISEIKESYAGLYPESDFSYSFFDETIAGFYKQEQNISRLLNWAMGLSILISCLGLLGLVIYISEARSKEIGIRKIMGASVMSLITMLSSEFILLVLIAFAIAAPVAWYAIDQWLETFVYKTEISWWIFLVGGFSLVLIAFITLSTQTFRSARSNPVNSLRNE
jgi:putative ABC transport system permease protein